MIEPRIKEIESRIKIPPFLILLSGFLTLSSPLLSLSKPCENALKSQLTSGGYQPHSQCGVAGDVMTWVAIQDKDPAIGLYDVTLFVIDHPDWPAMDKLCARAEGMMDETLEPESVVEWFDAHAPQTSHGYLNYARALKALSKTQKAKEIAQEGWIQRNFTREEAQEYLRAFGQDLTQADHNARLDRLLWDEEIDQAKRLLSLASPAVQKEAETRLALMQAESHITIPSHFTFEGVLYESVRALKKSKKFDQAATLLAQVPSQTQHADKWWKERHYVAREFLQDGHPQEAYALIQNHGLTSGESFADAEFLCGFLALRFLNNPDEALKHFTNLYDRVKSPISKSRGAYWAGRAAEAQDNVELAKDWYTKGAQHTTYFYGQLSAAKLQQSPHPQLFASPRATQQERKAFESQDVVQAFKILSNLGKAGENHAKTFAISIAKNAKTTAERHLLVDLAAHINSHMAVFTAKKAASCEGIHLKVAYPTLKHPHGIQNLESALVNGLVMQESRFDTHAVSPAGAMGLMQLMPATAKKEAQKMRVSHSENKLHDPHHNIQLGAHHLHSLVQEFNGSYILAIASYNAGKDAVNRWLAEIGDPRRNRDVVDWLELIPYYETRNYVQRVLENVNVYRVQTESQPQFTLVHDLQR